jgi:DNA-nicking Smr family endonuclease
VTKKTPDNKDSELFRLSVGKVKRVTNDKVELSQKTKPKPFPQIKTNDLGEKLSADSFYDTEQLSHEDTMAFTSPGVQKNVLKKLRKGHFGIDAELDLHGLTSEAAKQQLLRFLHFCFEDGVRSAHIIHGKGYRSSNNIPVLKNSLNLWLRQHQDVLAFCSAPARDGGAGAVYVLLRLSQKHREQEDPQE